MKPFFAVLALLIGYQAHADFPFQIECGAKSQVGAYPAIYISARGTLRGSRNAPGDQLQITDITFIYSEKGSKPLHYTPQSSVNDKTTYSSGLRSSSLKVTYPPAPPADNQVVAVELNLTGDIDKILGAGRDQGVSLVSLTYKADATVTVSFAKGVPVKGDVSCTITHVNIN